MKHTFFKIIIMMIQYYCLYIVMCHFLFFYNFQLMDNIGLTLHRIRTYFGCFGVLLWISSGILWKMCELGYGGGVFIIILVIFRGTCFLSGFRLAVLFNGRNHSFWHPYRKICLWIFIINSTFTKYAWITIHMSTVQHLKSIDHLSWISHIIFCITIIISHRFLLFLKRFLNHIV